MTSRGKSAPAGKVCNLSPPGPVGREETMPASDSSRTRDDLEHRILDEVPRIRAFLQHLCGAQLAEDLGQDVVERALRYRDSFDARLGTLHNWLMKTAFRTWHSRRMLLVMCLYCLWMK